MKNPLPAMVPAADALDHHLDRRHNDFPTTARPWLETLQPFGIQWELVWPM
jgi:hypothetical protein